MADSEKQARIIKACLTEFFEAQKNFHGALAVTCKAMDDAVPAPGESNSQLYIDQLKNSVLSQLPIKEAVKLDIFLEPYRQLSANIFSDVNLEGQTTEDLVKIITNKLSSLAFLETTLNPLMDAANNYKKFSKFLEGLVDLKEVSDNPAVLKIIMDLKNNQAIKPVQHGPRYELLLNELIAKINNNTLTQELDRVRLAIKNEVKEPKKEAPSIKSMLSVDAMISNFAAKIAARSPTHPILADINNLGVLIDPVEKLRKFEDILRKGSQMKLQDSFFKKSALPEFKEFQLLTASMLQQLTSPAPKKTA